MEQISSTLESEALDALIKEYAEQGRLCEMFSQFAQEGLMLKQIFWGDFLPQTFQQILEGHARSCQVCHQYYQQEVIHPMVANFTGEICLRALRRASEIH